MCVQNTGPGGWGARIRTWEWRNQNPTISPILSTHILKIPQNSTHVGSITCPMIQNVRPSPFLSFDRSIDGPTNNSTDATSAVLLSRLYSCRTNATDAAKTKGRDLFDAAPRNIQAGIGIAD